METASSLINHLIQTGVLTNKRILEAFKKIDRKNFVPEKLQDLAYRDAPLSIGNKQTISQPFTVAFMLDLLDVCEGDRVLDVGSGSGYTTALLANMVGPRGKVIGVEVIPELVELGRSNLNKYNFTHAEIRQSGKNLGMPIDAPYDKILVSAEATEIPNDLVSQLKVGGRMVIPITNDIWNVKVYTTNNLEIEKYPGFSFVPLMTTNLNTTAGKQ